MMDGHNVVNAPGEGTYSYGIASCTPGSSYAGTLTIGGSGTLEVNAGFISSDSTHSRGILCSNLNITGGTITSNGANYGVDVRHDFNFTSGTLIASGNKKALRVKGNLNLRDDAVVSVADNALGTNVQPWDGISDLTDNEDYKYMRISEFYDLYVGGRAVSPANKSDVLGDGTVSFDGTTLTLNNADIKGALFPANDPLWEVDRSAGILSGIDLELKLIGSNKITGGTVTGTNAVSAGIALIDKGGNRNGHRLNIYGPGRLETTGGKAQNGSSLGIVGSYANLYSGAVTAKGDDYGVFVYNFYYWGGALTAKGHFGLWRLPDFSMAPEMPTVRYGWSYDGSGAQVWNGTDNILEYSYINIEPSAYKIWVGGVQISPENAYDVLGDGTVSYDAADSTLTLNNARIIGTKASYSNDEMIGIESHVDLQLNLLGENTITVPGGQTYVQGILLCDDDGIQNNTKLTVKGPGKLDISVGASATNKFTYGVYASEYEQGSGTLISEGSNRAVFSDTEPVIKGGMLTLYGGVNAFYRNPDLSGYKPTANITVGTARDGSDAQPWNGTTILSTYNYVRIDPAYDLWVGGVQVTGSNADNVLGDGTVWFDPYETLIPVLHLRDANITGTGSPFEPLIQVGIESWISVILALEGTNTITAPDGAMSVGVYVSDHSSATQLLWVIGPGSLDVQAGKAQEGSVAIFSDFIIMQSGSVSAIADDVGILSTTFWMQGGRLHARGGQSGLSIYNGIRFTDYDPAPLVFVKEELDGNYEDWDLTTDLNTYKDVSISPSAYDVWVGGRRITPGNYDDVLGDGKVRFDPNTYTLTLNNADIQAGVHAGVSDISVGIDSRVDLTLNLIGENTIHMKHAAYVSYGVCLGDQSGAQNATTLTVTGTGSLVTELPSDSSMTSAAISARNVVVNSGTIRANATFTGIVSDRLIVNGGNVYARGFYFALSAEPDVSGYRPTAMSEVCPDYDGYSFELWNGQHPLGSDNNSAYCYVVIREPVNPFVDVRANDFFCNPVLWAYYHYPQVTNGTDATHFSPMKACTRGQVVTFLWRAVGCPEPTTTTHPFTDVKSSAFYYKAMLWAVENNITSGTSATTFSPNKDCTRGQVVTFLWRAVGSPEPKTTTHPFTDVNSSALFFYKAMLWAVENHITSGTSATTFSAGKSCTRGQVVTFLYRCFVKD